MTNSFNRIKAVFIGVFVYAILPLSATEKDINVLITALECYASQSASYIEVVDHVVSSDAQTSELNIIRHRLFRDADLYAKIQLNWKDSQLVSGTFKSSNNEMKIVVARKDGLINSIDIQGGGYEKHILEYNDKGQVVKLTQANKPGSDTERFYEVSYNENNKLSKILYILNNPRQNKSAPFTDKSFLYDGHSCKVHVIMYSGIETRKFKKKVYKVEDGSFGVIPEERKYITKVENQTDKSVWTTETTYDSNNKQVFLTDTNENSRRTAVNTIKLEYNKGLLIKETKFNYVDNKFGHHNVYVYYKINPSTNEYVALEEEDVSARSYDENGELIYEAKWKKQIYRKKVDGIWSDWMYLRV